MKGAAAGEEARVGGERGGVGCIWFEDLLVGRVWCLVEAMTVAGGRWVR